MIKNILCLIIPLALLSACHNQADQEVSIKVSKNGHYFIKDGKPFFWLGDTDWELFRVYSVPEAKALLEKRKEQGFSVIQVMATGVFPEAAGIVKMDPVAGLQAWLDYNPLTPNEKYFSRMDSVVKIAEELDMVLAVGVYHAWDQDRGRINVQNAEPWAKWFAGRYKDAKNIIWSMYPHARQASDSVVMAIVRGIREGGGGNHLITIHPDPGPVSSSIMHSEPWLSFNTIQTWTSKFRNYDMVADDYSKTPPKPVVDGEARYEGEDQTSPFETRRVAYWTLLGGGFYSYGHAGNWLYPLTWRDWTETPGAQQMKIVRDIFESVDWWNLVPDQSIITPPAEGNASARSLKGDWIMVYLTGKDQVRIKLDKIQSGSATCISIDPVTGIKTELGNYQTTAANNTFTLPDGREDILLIFKK